MTCPNDESVQPPTVPMGATVASACYVLLLTARFGLAGNANQDVPVFVWRDVAIVYLAAATPFALVLSNLVMARAGLPSRIVIGGTIWLIGLAILAGLAVDHSTQEISSIAASHFLTRSFVALGLTLPIASIWTRTRGRSLARFTASLTWIAVTAGIAIAIPEAYVIAHCQHDSARLSQLMGQSRLGEAEQVALRLVQFNPRAMSDGKSVLGLVANLDRQLAQLRADVNVHLAPGATEQETLSYAQKLAILDRTDEALEILERIQPPSPKVFNLLGTIRETRSEWQASLEDYRQAQTDWDTAQASPDRLAGLIRATTGVAFCLRKLGNYLAAEQAYQQLLELAPNAETHFLLAQFYEDTQQTKQAYRHVRQAMQLAPRRFQSSGQQLISKLTTSHFGCFNVSSTGSGD